MASKAVIAKISKDTMDKTRKLYAKEIKKTILERFDKQMSSKDGTSSWKKLETKSDYYKFRRKPKDAPLLNVSGDLRSSIDVIVTSTGTETIAKKIGDGKWSKGKEVSSFINKIRPFLEYPVDSKARWLKIFETELRKNLKRHKIIQ